MSDKILKIFYDPEPMSPRDSDCNFAKMIFVHPRYELGDSNPLNILRDDIINHPRYNTTTAESYNLNDARDLLEYAQKIDLFAVFQKVYCYEHSGITIDTEPFSCPWDSGMLGFMYVTKDDIRENWNIKRVTKQYLERAKQLMLAEFKTQKSYVDGENYGFAIFEKQEDGSIERTDTCHGFIGDDLKTNGLTDYVDEDLHEELERIFNEYDFVSWSEAMETEKSAEEVEMEY
tara:strand:- start:11141 stop:11836 length:696 start_codon:yes stop_codon:yes gene_type:complete